MQDIPTNAKDVRSQLVDALRLDLIGPDATGDFATPTEVLPQAPSRWFLTEFLVPLDAGEEHRAQDRAVLNAYGWTDIRPICRFLLDYEEDEEDNEPSAQPSAKGCGRKKPWRYRWPDEVRDEVLARLLELNKQRAEEEALSGRAAEAAIKKSTKKPRRRNGGDDDQPLLR